MHVPWRTTMAAHERSPGPDRSRSKDIHLDRVADTRSPRSREALRRMLRSCSSVRGTRRCDAAMDEANGWSCEPFRHEKRTWTKPNDRRGKRSTSKDSTNAAPTCASNADQMDVHVATCRRCNGSGWSAHENVRCRLARESHTSTSAGRIFVPWRYVNDEFDLQGDAVNADGKG